MRRLSDRGRADLERLAAHLAGIGWRPDRAFTSPLSRARESARIALRGSVPAPELQVTDALRPDADPTAVAPALVAAGAGAGHVLLVAHQPLLGLLAAHLTGAPAPGFAPGTLVRIEFGGPPDPGTGSLRWRLAPGFAS